MGFWLVSCDLCEIGFFFWGGCVVVFWLDLVVVVVMVRFEIGVLKVYCERRVDRRGRRRNVWSLGSGAVFPSSSFILVSIYWCYSIYSFFIDLIVSR
ncbi:hypothetical protein BDV97DRAFT_343216 [Delphinella strobiligena]|nr:hypothetical protein BDV97DRAFT_343216 [Delphinella strobiligena]